MNFEQDTICALSTPSSSGAIGVIRLSGPKAIEIVQNVFKGRNLSAQKTQSLHFGEIVKDGESLDEVLLVCSKHLTPIPAKMSLKFPVMVLLTSSIN
jgi:tRNA modification GTPase